MFATAENIHFSSVKAEFPKQEEICRLCAKTCDNYEEIFGNNDLYIPEKISRCLPIVVLENDTLPSFICRRCLHCLNISYRLIVTSVQVDSFFRKQLQTQSTISSKKITEPSESNKRNHEGNPKNNERSTKTLSLKQLKRRAIAGPAECEFCNITYADIDVFDTHMETIHLQKWKCNLCDNSFDKSSSLIFHKTMKHNGDVVTCKNCMNKTGESKNGTPGINSQENTEKINNLLQFSNEMKPSVQENSFILQTVHVTSGDLSVPYVQNDIKILETNNSNTDKPLEKERMSDKFKKKDPLVCNICKIIFGDKHYFNGHNKIHEPRHMTCALCCLEYETIYDLFLHKRDVHSMYRKVQLNYVCEKCGKFFANSWKWESHNGNECSKKLSDNTCKYCKTVFTTTYKLNRHLRKHKTEMFNDPTATIYKCVACPKVFVDKEFYEKHRNVHDPECWDKFKCNICDRPFRDKRRLREHQLFIHEGVKPHQCDVCGRTFHRLYNMKIHRATHFERKCNYCDMIFAKNRDLIKHIRGDHTFEPAVNKFTVKTTYQSSTHICRYCGKKLASYQSLINHEYIHTGEKPYKCKICHESFRSYTSRWAHTQRHEKGNFVCEHCGKCFSYKQNLTVHVLTHLPVEDRKHQCSVCEKKFLKKCHLNIHMRIHEGVRPYTCDICFFSFTQKGDMQRHRIRHNKGDFRVRSPRYKSTVVSKVEDFTNSAEKISNNKET